MLSVRHATNNKQLTTDNQPRTIYNLHYEDWHYRRGRAGEPDRLLSQRAGRYLAAEPAAGADRRDQPQWAALRAGRRRGCSPPARRQRPGRDRPVRCGAGADEIVCDGVGGRAGATPTETRRQAGKETRRRSISPSPP